MRQPQQSRYDLSRIPHPPRTGRIGQRAIAHCAARCDARRAEIRARMAERVRQILDEAAKSKPAKRGR